MVLLGSGCSLQPKPVTTSQQAEQTILSWAERQALLREIKTWEIRGRVSVQVAGQAWQSTFLWKKEPESEHLRLFGLLGAGGASLRRHGDSVEAIWSGKKYRWVGSITERLEEELGEPVPVDAFHAWMVGVPAWSTPSQYNLDKKNRIQSLTQQGWTVEIPRYDESHPVHLPKRLELQKGTIEVRIWISSWKINSDTEKRTTRREMNGI